MKRIFTILFACMCVFGLKAQSVMVCNFDDEFPEVGSWGDVAVDYLDAPADSPASGQMGSVWVPKSNPSDGGVYFVMNNTIDPRDFVGISFLANGPITVSFILKLEQSGDPNGNNRIQDWNTWPKYTGNGEWQEVHIPFDIALKSLGEKLAVDPNFPATAYDKVVLVPGPYENLPEFTINIDDVKLRTSWDTDGIPLVKAASFIITSVNGTVSAKATNGAPATIKVYSISGQEIAEGLNQVQLGTKGVYIVKAAAGNANMVSKIIVK